MEPAEYDYMFHLEDAYWWYVGMRRICEGLLRRDLVDGNSRLQILDAGSGTGGSLSLLEPFGEVTAFDFEERAAEMYRSRRPGRILVASIDAIPFSDESFDLVTSFEVVCQVTPPADEKALSEMARVLKRGGGLMVRVPAFQFLYGPHDVVLHTKHRYSADEVSSKLERAGLKPVRITYANTFLFPVAFLRRTLARLRKPREHEESDVRPVPAPINRLLTAILSTEASILAHTRLPVGLSIIALARKE